MKMIVVNFDILIHKGFTVIQKIAFSELCKAWRHNYSIFQFLFSMEKVGEEEGDLEKTEYLENEKSFLGKRKRIFNFLRALVKFEKIADITIEVCYFD